MCPACYINGLLFLIFGAAGASIANNPWVIAISVILTIAGFSQPISQTTIETTAIFARFES